MQHDTNSSVLQTGQTVRAVVKLLAKTRYATTKGISHYRGREGAGGGGGGGSLKIPKPGSSEMLFSEFS